MEGEGGLETDPLTLLPPEANGDGKGGNGNPLVVTQGVDIRVFDPPLNIHIEQ
jgi:hypothetical protein